MTAPPVDKTVPPVSPVSAGPALARPDTSDATRKDVHRGGGVVVAQMPTPHQAELIRLRLETADIEAWLLDDNTTSMGSAFAIAVGGTKVVVADADLEAARAVLDAEPDGAPPLEAWGDAGPTEDDALRPLPEAQALANRALAAAVLGLMLPVVAHLYSLWLLFRLRGLSAGHTPASTAKAGVALLIDALALLVTFAILFSGEFFYLLSSCEGRLI